MWANRLKMSLYKTLYRGDENELIIFNICKSFIYKWM